MPRPADLDPLLKKHPRQKWLPFFKRFIAELRIDSKEIQAEDERGSRLQLWGSQEMAMRTLLGGLENDVREFYYLKGRQQGITTITLAIDLFWLLVHPRILGCLVVDTPENRDTFRDTLDRMIASLPVEFVGKGFKVKRHNSSHLLLPNASRLDYLVAGTKNKAAWAESRGYVLAHLTEVSKYGTRAGIDSFREAMSETHPNRLMIAESTANGWANVWHDLWDEAGRDTLTKARCFTGWWAKELNRIKVSDRRYENYGRAPPNQDERELMAAVWEKYKVKINQEQLTWYRWRDANKAAAEGSMAQNQPWTEEEAFIRTGHSFFQLKLIQKKYDYLLENEIEFSGYRFYLGETIEAGVCERITEQERLSEVEFRVWEEPIPGATYVIGCDPAFGRNEYNDNHAIAVCRCYADKLVQVAEYASNSVMTHHCAWVLAYLASWYQNCWINIELGGPGRAVLRELDVQKQRLRTEFYKPKPRSELAEDETAFLEHARWYMYHRPDSPGAGYLYHFETTWRTKFELMNQFRDSFVTNMFVPFSVRLLEEMGTMVQEKSDIAPASPGGAQKDDRVFANALCNRTWLDWTRPQMMEMGYTYESVMADENGENKPNPMQIVNLIVQGFLANISNAEPEGNRFLQDRGFD